MPRLIKAKEIDSTNEWIKKHLNKLEDLDSIIAETQTAGKSRNAKDWFSPKGGFCFSFILKEFSGNSNSLSLLSAVIVCEIMRKYDLPAKIKWPNDIILKEKKLGGILIENIQGNFIVGIGLNLNLSISDFPIPLKDIVTTSKESLHKDLEFEPIAKEIIKGIAKGRKNLEEIHQKYKEFSGDLNRKVRILKGNETFIGKVKEIQPDGGIKIVNETAEKVFYSGSLTYLD
jgi:BirA family transcriptional regulator, biotin operon repressor / biotin---[acetyl-CoA-carboxylase] ligase